MFFIDINVFFNCTDLYLNIKASGICFSLILVNNRSKKKQKGCTKKRLFPRRLFSEKKSESANPYKQIESKIKKSLPKKKVSKSKANLPRAKQSNKIVTNKHKPLLQLPGKLSEALTGNLLGDGHLRFNHKKDDKGTGNAQLAFTFKDFNYISHLKIVIYSHICTLAAVRPWPNPITTGKTPTQYTLSTKCLPILTLLHSQWYTWSISLQKYVKIVPLNIGELLTSISLAFWIMDDGYWDKSGQTVCICTDNFTLNEVNLLIDTIKCKFDLIATPQRRIKANKEICWRIRFSRKADNLSKLRSLVQPHFIPSMLYKLNNTI